MVRKLIERRRRGVFGWFMLIVFWIANGLMALWLFSTMAQWGQIHPVTEAERTGAGIGIAIGLGVIFSIWACIAFITGMFALMTRGRKEIIELDE